MAFDTSCLSAQGLDGYTCPEGYSCPGPRACIKHQREICCCAFTVTTGEFDLPTQSEIMLNTVYTHALSKHKQKVANSTSSGTVLVPLC